MVRNSREWLLNRARDTDLFLGGMMILAELARENGVFEWMADLAAVGAKQSAWRLFALTYLVGTVVTALLSNDATAVVLTPAILAIVRKAKVEPKPYLLACAFVANAQASFFQSPIRQTLWFLTGMCRRLQPG